MIGFLLDICATDGAGASALGASQKSGRFYAGLTKALAIAQAEQEQNPSAAMFMGICGPEMGSSGQPRLVDLYTALETVPYAETISPAQFEVLLAGGTTKQKRITKMIAKQACNSFTNMDFCLLHSFLQIHPESCGKITSAIASTKTTAITIANIVRFSLVIPAAVCARPISEICLGISFEWRFSGIYVGLALVLLPVLVFAEVLVHLTEAHLAKRPLQMLRNIYDEAVLDFQHLTPQPIETAIQDLLKARENTSYNATTSERSDFDYLQKLSNHVLTRVTADTCAAAANCVVPSHVVSQEAMTVNDNRRMLCEADKVYLISDSHNILSVDMLPLVHELEEMGVIIESIRL